MLNAVRGISDLITIHGLINLDFADVRTVMNEAGVALMGTGVGHGDTRAADAAAAAISSPLLEDLSIEGARGVLINITGADDMTLFEVNEASTLIQEAAHEEANIIFGAVVDNELPEGEVRVTVIATGLEDGHVRKPRDDGRRRRDDDWDRRDREQLSLDDNITPLHRENHREDRREEEQREAPPASARREEPVDDRRAERRAERHEYERDEREVRERGGRDLDTEVTADELARSGADFASPFEDELDTPAFLRKRQSDSDDEDHDTPTFLRRAQD